jgi:hypothetical protein
MFRIGLKLKSPKINLSAYGDLTPNSPLGISKDEVSVLGFLATVLNYPLIKIRALKKSSSQIWAMPPPSLCPLLALGLPALWE